MRRPLCPFRLPIVRNYPVVHAVNNICSNLARGCNTPVPPPTTTSSPSDRRDLILIAVK